MEIATFPHRFAPVDAAIAKSIRDGDEARERRDRARTVGGYRKADDAVHAAQDAHTAAWAERHRLCALWDEHYRKTYL